MILSLVVCVTSALGPFLHWLKTVPKHKSPPEIPLPASTPKKPRFVQNQMEPKGGRDKGREEVVKGNKKAKTKNEDFWVTCKLH